MEDQQSRFELFEKFSWKVEKFTRVSSIQKVYSEPFVLCGYPWRILVYPYGNGDNTNSMSTYLDTMQSPNSYQGGTRDVTFRLVVFNQFDSTMSIKQQTHHVFSERERDWGFTSFMPLVELHNHRLGFIVNDSCIVGAEVYVHNSRYENEMNRTGNLMASLLSNSITYGSHISGGHMEVPRPEAQVPNLESLSEFPILVRTEPTRDIDMEFFKFSIGELMDFMALGQVETYFVPLLEKACSQHPSLIECQQRRSRRFTEWAFTALGRVLYFLKTRKAKDMNDQACKDLQILWEELEIFGFDLAWLEPHVQFALRMKSYVEKAVQMEMLKENAEDIALEMERLKTKLATLEVDLNIARDLLMEEGFNGIDLNVELGYGIP